jgi:hypothetical protein
VTRRTWDLRLASRKSLSMFLEVVSRRHTAPHSGRYTGRALHLPQISTPGAGKNLPILSKRMPALEKGTARNLSAKLPPKEELGSSPFFTFCAPRAERPAAGTPQGF